MCELFSHPINRQQFLRISAGLLGGLIVPLNDDRATGEERNAADPQASCPLRLALLSDTHLAADPEETYRGFKPLENLQEVIRQVLIAQPQAVVLNGDAARLEGQLVDYQQLQQVLAPLAERAPIGIGLGNHDDRKNFMQVFADQAGCFAPQSGLGRQVLVMEHSLVRLIVLDSLLYVNQVAGLLGKAQREWLSSYLADNDDRPTALFVHHTLGDNDGELLDADRLFRIVEPHACVKAIFYGHSHRYQLDRRGRLHLINLPACGYNFGDDQPVGWVDARFESTGCQLTLWAIGGNMAENGKSVTLAWDG
jgi:Icc protein